MRSEAAASLTLSDAGHGAGAFLRKQTCRMAGLALLGGVAFALLSLNSWNVADPSFSHATDNPVTNTMGFAGAAFADIAMQFYGLSAVVALAPAVIWGILLLCASYIDRKIRRIIAWLASSLLFAGIAGCLTPPTTWPLPTGLGGVLGDMILKAPALAIGSYPSGLFSVLIAFVLALPALGLAAFGSGLLFRRAAPVVKPAAIRDEPDFNELVFDEDNDGRLLAWGAVTHWWLSMCAMVRRKLAAPHGGDLREAATPPPSRAWREAAERVEVAEEAEAASAPAISRVARARVEPEFDAPEFGFAPEPEWRDQHDHASPRASFEDAAFGVEEPVIHDRRAFNAPEPEFDEASREEPAYDHRVRTPPEHSDYARELENSLPPLHYPLHHHEQADELHAEETAYHPADFEALSDGVGQPEKFDLQLKPGLTYVQRGRSIRSRAQTGEVSKAALTSSGRLRVETHPVQAAPVARDTASRPVPTPVAAPMQTRPVVAAPRPEPVTARKVEAQAPRPAPVARQDHAPLPRLNEPDGFQLPSMQFLSQPKNIERDPSLSEEELEHNARMLEGVLEDFGVKGEIIHVRAGPVVTLYELEPAPGIKSSRVIGLADDIARSMSAISCRVAVVPGRNAIGIELPNVKREMVFLREILCSHDFEETKAKLALALGKTINGEPVIVDIAKMPHVLVAGTTGSGKSVAINTMILSLLYRMTPDECRLIMIDPKMLELSVYDGIPHLLTPVVTDPKKAVVALKWTVREMEDRYRKMSKVGVRNIDGFNARVAQARQNGEEITRTVQTGFDRETGEAIYESESFDLSPLPYIVVIIDEMADLMMVAGKDIEGAVQRLAQMARAAGIHVIMATQRPSVDVITGTIKANFPTRISFQVTSKIDSRTILGEMGAEQLLGQGDMLYMAGGGRIQRVHGPFVSDGEVEKVVGHLKTQGAPEYLDAITQEEDEEGGAGAPARGGGSGGSNFEDSEDPYDQAVSVVLRDGKASTSYIQRRLGIGYNRAASIIERMEQEGIVGPANHAGKREILVPTEEDKM